MRICICISTKQNFSQDTKSHAFSLQPSKTISPLIPSGRILTSYLGVHSIANLAYNPLPSRVPATSRSRTRRKVCPAINVRYMISRRSGCTSNVGKSLLFSPCLDIPISRHRLLISAQNWTKISRSLDPIVYAHPMRHFCKHQVSTPRQSLSRPNARTPTLLHSHISPFRVLLVPISTNLSSHTGSRKGPGSSSTSSPHAMLP
jgi:hypothetical protein